jgi:hypothetical protein
VPVPGVGGAVGPPGGGEDELLLLPAPLQESSGTRQASNTNRQISRFRRLAPSWPAKLIITLSPGKAKASIQPETGFQGAKRAVTPAVLMVNCEVASAPPCSVGGEKEHVLLAGRLEHDKLKVWPAAALVGLKFKVNIVLWPLATLAWAGAGVKGPAGFIFGGGTRSIMP